MDQDTLVAVQAFVARAQRVMRSIPLPVQPLPSVEDGQGWDGEVLEVQALHDAYKQLSPTAQVAAAHSFRQCVQVLERQDELAHDAERVCYRMLADIIERWQRAMVEYRDANADDNDSDSDNIWPGQVAAPIVLLDDDPADDEHSWSRRWRPLAAAAAGGVVLVCMVTLMGQHLTSSPDQTPESAAPSATPTTASPRDIAHAIKIDMTSMWRQFASYAHWYLPAADDHPRPQPAANPGLPPSVRSQGAASKDGDDETVRPYQYEAP